MSEASTGQLPAEPANLFPPLTVADVNTCRHSSWHPRFRAHTPKTSILNVPEPFISYLEADGITVPRASDLARPSQEDYQDSSSSSSDGEEDEYEADGSDEEAERQPKWCFPEFDAAVRQVIDKYDAVFPKFNWSAPQDAQWMLPNPSLKCLVPADIYLLLKSSDFVTHDLTMAYDDCIDGGPSNDEEVMNDRTFELVLKKWFDMPRSSEWRCFVRHRRLIGISQRDLTFYDFLQDARLQSKVKAMVQLFFNEVVLPNFPLDSFTFDIYFTRTLDRVFLIDFNPYAPRTDALLFDWTALAELFNNAESSSEAELRILDDPAAAQGTLPRFSHNAYPADVVTMSQDASTEDFGRKWQENVVEAVTEGMARQDLNTQS